MDESSLANNQTAKVNRLGEATITRTALTFSLNRGSAKEEEHELPKIIAKWRVPHASH
jgi:hypothetical protein